MVGIIIATFVYLFTNVLSAFTFLFYWSATISGLALFIVLLLFAFSFSDRYKSYWDKNMLLLGTPVIIMFVLALLLLPTLAYFMMVAYPVEGYSTKVIVAMVAYVVIAVTGKSKSKYK